VGQPATSHLARSLAYGGLRRTQPQWRAGLYRGEYVLERPVNGTWVAVLRIERTEAGVVKVRHHGMQHTGCTTTCWNSDPQTHGTPKIGP